MELSGHAELFEHGALVHSTRPDEFLCRSCPVCSAPLGVTKTVVLFGDFHAHEDCAKGKGGLRRIAGGVSICPAEGLDLTIRLLIATTWYIRLFTSGTVVTVPSDDSTLTGGVDPPYTTGMEPVVECIGDNYEGLPITPDHWDTSILDASIWETGVTGRRIIANDQTFPETVDDWGIINGFFLATTAGSSGQNTGIALLYANFYDGQAVIMNGPGFTLQVTPYIQLDTG